MNIIRSILFIGILFLSGKANSQTAPNFTVTDSWGNTHRLYEDYLDKGTTVLLKIFYVACPPCNIIAPHLEPLYQDWGAGQADVQFIELSIRQTDTNPLVNSYKTTHATTYPAAGGQGNSVPATVPYTNGTFGLWTGTPTFVVIAPDRTLQYDVYGVNTQGTIDALDAAIAATGAQGSTTSITTQPINKEVELLSNIVTNSLDLKLYNDIKSLNINVVNPLGQLILNKNFRDPGRNIMQLDISDVPSGMWICRIEDENHRFMASYLFLKI